MSLAFKGLSTRTAKFKRCRKLFRPLRSTMRTFHILDYTFITPAGEQRDFDSYDVGTLTEHAILIVDEMMRSNLLAGYQKFLKFIAREKS